MSEIFFLKEGDTAPDFQGVSQNGKAISLSQYRGRKVVLFFYPKDMTPGCTMEVKSLRDSYEEFTSNGFVVVGVSADSEERHLKFISKYDLPFDLIADEDKVILKAYGVWGLKKFMGKEYEGIHRVTFIIDENGMILKIIDKVKTKKHAQQIFECFE